MLAALVPTVLMTAIGIILVASGGAKSLGVVGGILVLAFCATALAGYTMGSIFVTRGANLASVQNEFLSSVSHEIRTPLTSILMFIETLRGRPDRVIRSSGSGAWRSCIKSWRGSTGWSAS